MDLASRPAILMWREDYDAMRKELEELRENWSFACKDKAAAISELAKAEKELEEWRQFKEKNKAMWQGTFKQLAEDHD